MGLDDTVEEFNFSDEELELIPRSNSLLELVDQSLSEKYSIEVESEKQEPFTYSYIDSETIGDHFVLDSDQVDYLDMLATEYKVNAHHLEKFIGVGLPIYDIEGYLQFHKEYNQATKEAMNYLTFDNLVFIYSVTRGNYESVDEVRQVVSTIADDLGSTKGVGELLYNIQHNGLMNSLSVSVISTLNILPNRQE